MTDDDTPRPHHAEDMRGIDPPERDLRIVRVNTAQDKTMTQLRDDLAHPRAEKARSGAEVPGRRLLSACNSVGLVDHILYSFDLLDQLRLTQRARWLVVHRMIGELVVVPDQVVEDRLAARDMSANDEKCRRGIVRVEDLQYLLRVLGRPVVDGERYELLSCGHMPQDVGPSTLQVADDQAGRLVDDVQRDSHQEEQQNEGDQHEVGWAVIVCRGEFVLSGDGTWTRDRWWSVRRYSTEYGVMLCKQWTG